MRKCLIVVIALLYSFIGVNIVFATDGTWTQKADFGGGNRVFAVGFSIGDKGYMGTGLGSGGYASDFWEYDPSLNTWTQKADPGGPGAGSFGFSIGNKGYVSTYMTNDVPIECTDNNNLWEYNPAANTWTRKTDISWPTRTFNGGFVIGDKFYSGTGCCLYETFNDFWEYDPSTDIWTRKADFGGTARIGAAGFTIGSKGYMGTGMLGNANYGGPITNDFWEYDPNGGNYIYLVPVADKTTLWPPNNKMVAVTIQANVSSSEPVILTAQVSCNESAKRDKDWTEPVIDQETGVISLSLRATRSGNGTGRIYTITITATDANGNSASEIVAVSVPHDQVEN